ncbi:MAG: hypothetical protein JXB62_16205 [Pirellulales bacterium]|nr:hypothetical protein [Pirellulales bacterium]
MSLRIAVAAALLVSTAPFSAAEEAPAVSGRYQALKCPTPAPTTTWAILDRDGANSQVAPYLSSLGQGESATGVIASPAFAISTEAITFTLCGHDGMGGGHNANYLALVDAGTGATLQKTPAPGSDAMQERSWDVGPLRGRQVRIEVHDGDAGGAYAWLGVGRIDAGGPLSVDFGQGMPKDWKARSRPQETRTELVRGGVPFLRQSATYTIVPSEAAVEIPCGFAAQRLFFLGGTVADGKPTEVYGTVEIVYGDGSTERCPLMYGYTLDGDGKLPSRSGAIHLHASGDPFQRYLVLRSKAGPIDKIRLQGAAQGQTAPRITAITCETASSSENLLPLPECPVAAEEQAWIEAHAISPDSPNMEEILVEIRRAHKM